MDIHPSLAAAKGSNLLLIRSKARTAWHIVQLRFHSAQVICRNLTESAPIRIRSSSLNIWLRESRNNIYAVLQTPGKGTATGDTSR